MIIIRRDVRADRKTTRRGAGAFLSYRLRLPTFRHAGRSGAIFGPGVFARVMGRLGFGFSGTPVSRPTQFIPALQASGSLFLGNARFQACKQSLRCFANRFEVLPCLVPHENHHGARSFGSVQKGFGEFKND